MAYDHKKFQRCTHPSCAYQWNFTANTHCYQCQRRITPGGDPPRPRGAWAAPKGGRVYQPPTHRNQTQRRWGAQNKNRPADNTGRTNEEQLKVQGALIAMRPSKRKF